MTFEELYRRYFPDVHRFALYLTGDPAEAEDIASETFVRAWAADAPLRAQRLDAYLFSIARNLHRRGYRRRRLDALAADMPDAPPGPERELAGRGELAATLAQLQALPEVDRAALLMRAFHELSYDEIAAALGLSVSSAKVKVHRARTALKAHRSQS